MGGFPNLAYLDVVNAEMTGFAVAPDCSVHPELRLLVAVLERAVRDYLGSNKRRQEEAARWLFTEISDANSGEPFSFAWICEELGLAPEPLHKTLTTLLKTGTKKRRVRPFYRGARNVGTGALGLVSPVKKDELSPDTDAQKHDTGRTALPFSVVRQSLRS